MTDPMNYDLTARWAFNPRNPKGPLPDTPKTESFTEREAREYYQRKTLTDLYGPQDRTPSKPQK